MNDKLFKSFTLLNTTTDNNSNNIIVQNDSLAESERLRSDQFCVLLACCR